MCILGAGNFKVNEALPDVQIGCICNIYWSKYFNSSAAVELLHM